MLAVVADHARAAQLRDVVIGHPEQLPEDLPVVLAETRACPAHRAAIAMLAAIVGLYARSGR